MCVCVTVWFVESFELPNSILLDDEASSCLSLLYSL